MSSANNLVSALSCSAFLIAWSVAISECPWSAIQIWSAHHHVLELLYGLLDLIVTELGLFFLSRSKFFSLLCMMEQIEVVLKWYKEMSSSVSVCQGKSCMEKWSSHRWLKWFSSFISSSIQVLRIYWTSFKHWMQPTSWKWSLQSGKVSDGHVAS